MSRRRLAYSATRGEILGLVSLISLHKVRSAQSTNQLEPPNPFPGTSGNTAVAWERWPGRSGPPACGLLQLVIGGDGAAEPCAPPSFCSAWPCCGAVDLPIEWNREKLMGLWIGVVGRRDHQGVLQSRSGWAHMVWEGMQRTPWRGRSWS